MSDELKTIKLNVSGLKCEGCSLRIKGALESVMGVSAVEIDHVSGKTLIKLADNAPQTDELMSVVKNLGYEAALLV